ncbi:hypothetical protein [Flavobacterium psychrotrophum]|uniref:hypothetical protein n=1 Tax=Flavobacterium psychrotrophum TaxID=2294119 RepID=UPI000E3112E9|nr:hypothetical protein [Flavobacterium psychrotrophum]
MKTKIVTLFTTIAICAISCKDKTETVVEETTVEETAPQPEAIAGEQCFLQVTENKADASHIIRDSIIFQIQQRRGDSIWGVYEWRPQEKDKKIATYKGVINGNMGTAVANSKQEGSTFNEEVIFTITDSAVAIKYGEMTESKDGILRYKNKNAAQEQILSKVDCK